MKRKIDPNMDEMEFINTMPDEISRHIGEWIVMVGNDIIYAGEDVQKGYDMARAKYPDHIPFIVNFPKERVILPSTWMA